MTNKEEEVKPVEEPKEEKEETVTVSRKEFEELKSLVHATADKGRLFNYEAKKTDKKPLRVHLSKFGGGLIVGWRTVKDQLVKHPTTGRTVGEEQEFEIMILLPDSTIQKKTLNGYTAFSDARYNDRAEVEVEGRKEDWDGKVTYTVRLPDGRTYDLSDQFVN